MFNAGISNTELKRIEDGVNGYVVPFDMQDIDVKKIYEHIPTGFTYKSEDKEILKRWRQIIGTKVELTGKIKTGNYTNKDGAKVYYTEVRANSVGFGESKADAENRGQAQEQQPAQQDNGSGFMDIPDGLDEELPFK